MSGMAQRPPGSPADTGGMAHSDTNGSMEGWAEEGRLNL